MARTLRWDGRARRPSRPSAIDRPQPPILLCYDRSAGAAQAIAQAARVLGGGPALVLHVWSSVAVEVPLRRYMTPEVSETITDVIAELDRGSLALAHEIAEEGAGLAGDAGLDARPVVVGVPATVGGHPEGNVARAIVRAAEEHDAGVVALGSRGLSEFESALLGSVSYGVAQRLRRPLLIVPSHSTDGEPT